MEESYSRAIFSLRETFILGLLCFHVGFIVIFCIPVKNVVGLFVGIVASCRLLLAMQPFS